MKKETPLANAAAPAKPKKATLSQAAAKKPKKGDAPATTKTTAEIRKEMAENAKTIQGSKDKPAEKLIKVEPLIVSTRGANDIIAEKIVFHQDGKSIDIHESLTAEEFPVVLGWFHRLEEGVGFIIGDLLKFAESHYGAKYTAAVEATGLSAKTLMNTASVCRKVAPEMRREELTFSHHASVAALPAAKQKNLLEKAVKEKLTVSKLNKLVKAATPPKPTKVPKKPKAGDDVNTEAPAEVQLNEEQTAENDSAIENADALESFVRGKTFANLPPSKLKTWASILSTFAKAYEALVKKGFASK